MNATPDGAPAGRGRFRTHADTVLQQSWSAFHPVPALYCLPAVALSLAIGLAVGQPGPAILAAAGAFSVGFGAFQRITRFHIAPMVLAAVCMAVSIAVGTAVSETLRIYVAVVGVAAFSLGLAASFGTGPWWVLLQGALFLAVAGAQPGDLHEAVARGLLVLIGGLAQSLVVAALRTLAPVGFPPLSAPNAAPPPASRAEWLAEARRVLRLGSPEMRYAVLLALATAAAVLIARRLSLANGYWAPLTVLLVLRRGGTETITRGVQRMGGTLIGAGLATFIVALLRPEVSTLVMLVTAAAWLSYATQWVNYGTFSVSVTSYIVFLISLEGLPEPEVAAHRVVATVLGGLIGIAALALAHLGRKAIRLSGREPRSKRERPLRSVAPHR